MLSIKIEGFTVNTTIDEARPYTRMYDKDDVESFTGELYGIVMPVIEQMIIGGQSAASFYCEHRNGYKDSRLEPFQWRETKKLVRILYTGARGGDEYQIEVLK